MNKIDKIIAEANESELHGFVFGLFPARISEYGLTKEETAEIMRIAQEKLKIEF